MYRKKEIVDRYLCQYGNEVLVVLQLLDKLKAAGEGVVEPFIHCS
jgi:hypothetical protein